MVKKKISGQTIAIIILIVLLICAITFGGVFAFYSTSTDKVTGTIMMANLEIDYVKDNPNTPEIEGVVGGQSGKSEILITNMNNIVPNELLGNSPLKVINNSTAPIYLVVLYRVQKATENEDKHIDDIYRYKRDRETNKYILDGNGQKQLLLDKDGNKQVFGVIDIGTQYENSIWTDFVFDTNDYPEYAQDSITTNDDYIVRTFVTVIPNTDDVITVIEKNNLRMHGDVGNEFQQQSISFTFQADAIGANSFDFDDNTPVQEKCAEIVKAVYSNCGYSFNI